MALKTKHSPLQKFSLNNLLVTWGDLPQREKVMAMIFSTLLLILLLFLPFYFLSGKMSSMKKEMVKIDKGFKDIQEKLVEYQKSQVEIQRIENRFGKFGGSLPSRVTTLAQDVGVSVDQVREKPVQETDVLTVSSLEVKLANVGLSQLMSFLGALENDKISPMVIRRLQVKPKNTNRQMMDVTFEVASFTLKKEG